MGASILNDIVIDVDVDLDEGPYAQKVSTYPVFIIEEYPSFFDKEVIITQREGATLGIIDQKLQCSGNLPESFVTSLEEKDGLLLNRIGLILYVFFAKEYDSHAAFEFYYENNQLWLSAGGRSTVFSEKIFVTPQELSFYHLCKCMHSLVENIKKEVKENPYSPPLKSKDDLMNQ